MTSIKGWSAIDVERWSLPSSWVGDAAPVTLDEVRRAARRLAASWGLDLDEVVSFFWEALQSPGLATSDNKAAYVWRVVRRRVSTSAAARYLLQGEHAASFLKGSLGGDGREFVHVSRVRLCGRGS